MSPGCPAKTDPAHTCRRRTRRDATGSAPPPARSPPETGSRPCGQQIFASVPPGFRRRQQLKAPVPVDALVAHSASATVFRLDHPQVVEAQIGSRPAGSWFRKRSPNRVDTTIVEVVIARRAEEACLALLAPHAVDADLSWRPQLAERDPGHSENGCRTGVRGVLVAQQHPEHRPRKSGMPPP